VREDAPNEPPELSVAAGKLDAQNGRWTGIRSRRESAQVRDANERGEHASYTVGVGGRADTSENCGGSDQPDADANNDYDKIRFGVIAILCGVVPSVERLGNRRTDTH
jgi:hypothetical protein